MIYYFPRSISKSSNKCHQSPRNSKIYSVLDNSCTFTFEQPCSTMWNTLPAQSNSHDNEAFAQEKIATIIRYHTFQNFPRTSEMLQCLYELIYSWLSSILGIIFNNMLITVHRINEIKRCSSTCINFCLSF